MPPSVHFPPVDVNGKVTEEEHLIGNHWRRLNDTPLTDENPDCIPLDGFLYSQPFDLVSSRPAPATDSQLNLTSKNLNFCEICSQIVLLPAVQIIELRRNRPRGRNYLSKFFCVCSTFTVPHWNNNFFFKTKIEGSANNNSISVVTVGSRRLMNGLFNFLKKNIFHRLMMAVHARKERQRRKFPFYLVNNNHSHFAAFPLKKGTPRWMAFPEKKSKQSRKISKGNRSLIHSRLALLFHRRTILNASFMTGLFFHRNSWLNIWIWAAINGSNWLLVA